MNRTIEWLSFNEKFFFHYKLPILNFVIIYVKKDPFFNFNQKVNLDTENYRETKILFFFSSVI